MAKDFLLEYQLIGLGISAVIGLTLLWLGLIRIAAQPVLAGQRRLGWCFSLAGATVFIMAITAAVWITSEEAAMPQAGNMGRNIQCFVSVTALLQLAISLSQSTLLTMAYRRHGHRISEEARVLLLLWIAGSLPLPFWHWVTTWLPLRIPVGLASSLIGYTALILLNLPGLVLGWLLVTGKLLKEPTLKPATQPEHG